jgi:hypothetical protein
VFESPRTDVDVYVTSRNPNFGILETFRSGTNYTALRAAFSPEIIDVNIDGIFKFKHVTS